MTATQVVSHARLSIVLLLMLTVTQCALPPGTAWKVIREDGFRDYLAISWGKKPVPEYVKELVPEAFGLPAKSTELGDEGDSGTDRGANEIAETDLLAAIPATEPPFPPIPPELPFENEPSLVPAEGPNPLLTSLTKPSEFETVTIPDFPVTPLPPPPPLAPPLAPTVQVDSAVEKLTAGTSGISFNPRVVSQDELPEPLSGGVDISAAETPPRPRLVQKDQASLTASTASGGPDGGVSRQLLPETAEEKDTSAGQAGAEGQPEPATVPEPSQAGAVTGTTDTTATQNPKTEGKAPGRAEPTAASSVEAIAQNSESDKDRLVSIENPVQGRKDTGNEAIAAALAALPYAVPVPGRPGYVLSPFAQSHQLVDVAGIKEGNAVRCPFSGRFFRIPVGLAQGGREGQRKAASASGPLPEAAP